MSHIRTPSSFYGEGGALVVDVADDVRSAEVSMAEAEHYELV
jgi:hypothetical protein